MATLSHSHLCNPPITPVNYKSNMRVHCEHRYFTTITDATYPQHTTMGKFSIFKDDSYPWRQEFFTKNLLSLNVAHLKQSAFLPFEFANYMPVKLAFLNRPLQLLHFGIVLVAAFHMAVLFLYTFYVMLAYRTDDIKLTEISDCLVQGCIYCGACNAIVYYRRNQNENKEMINFINANFKRRSTIGIYAW